MAVTRRRARKLCMLGRGCSSDSTTQRNVLGLGKQQRQQWGEWGVKREARRLRWLGEDLLIVLMWRTGPQWNQQVKKVGKMAGSYPEGSKMGVSVGSLTLPPAQDELRKTGSNERYRSLRWHSWSDEP